jgi:hypothetical protein
MNEIWKSVLGYEGLLEISNQGRMRSLNREVKRGLGKSIMKGKVLSQWKTTTGYWGVKAEMNGKTKHFRIHREVAKAFIPNPENKDEVNHKDHDRLNNSVDNLEWVTRAENRQKAIEFGAYPKEKLPKPVRAFTEDYKHIGDYDSTYAVAKALNLTKGSVHYAIIKQVAHKGYRFQRIVDEGSTTRQ